MKSKTNAVVRIILLAILLMMGSAPVTAMPQAQSTPPGLFALVEGSGAPASMPGVTRARFVEINLGLLRDGGGTSERVTLNLFDDTVHVAVRDRVQATGHGYVWTGHLDGVEHSLVTLVVHEAGLLIGKVATPVSLYEVRYDGAAQLVVELDPAAFPPELEPIPVNAPAPDSPPAITADNDGELIDVLVVYSTNAKNAVGGQAAMEALIDLGVAETNQSYANSGITQRVALVYAGEVTDAADDFSTDLGRLRITNDGYMDIVHTWRDTYHADETALIIDNSSSCGRAYLMDTVSTGFQTWAFAVVHHGCATGYYSLGHEWGHNMGARHDWYVDDTSTNSPYPYDKGFVNVADSWRTVMAYNTLCSDQGGSCTRLPYWSNPNVSYGGDPMGIVDSGPTNCSAGSTSPDPSTCAADNRMTLDNTAPTVDQFRNSESVWQGSDGNWNDAGNWSLGYVPRAIDDVYIPAAASSFPTVNSNYTARNVTIESGATLNHSSGTLTVYGDWDNQGTYNATGGTVIFAGTLDQSIASGGSAFPNLQIGDGTSTQAVSLTDDLDVDGDLTIQAGATLSGGARTINVAGDWTDYGTSFAPGTSTVVFDGASQSISKLNTTSTVLAEDFSYRDGYYNQFTTAPPTGWTTVKESNGTGNPGATWLFGDLDTAPNQSPYGLGYARRWYDSTATEVDAWLFSPAMELNTDTLYTLSFRYGVSTSSDAQDFEAHLGTGASAAQMTSQIVQKAGANNTSWLTATQTFQVATTGTYHLGFRNHDTSVGSGRGGLDNIVLTGESGLTFYNLTLANSGAATPNGDVVVNNDLTVNAGGALDLGTHTATVEGTLANNGTLSQTLTVGSGGTAEFLRITDAAGSTTKYYGVDITPSSTGLGSTTVGVMGNQAQCTTVGGDDLLTRCYKIEPGSAQNATVRLWFTEAERNNQAANALALWHYDGPPAQWSLGGNTYSRSETGSACNSGGGMACWLQAANVSSYSPFGVGSGAAPNAITARSLRGWGGHVALLMGGVALVAAALTRKRR